MAGRRAPRQKYTTAQLKRMSNKELRTAGFIRIAGFTRSDGTKVKSHTRKLTPPEKSARDSEAAREVAGNIIDFIPIIGDAKAFKDSADAFMLGNNLEGSILGVAGAVGLVPFVGDFAAKPLKVLAKSLKTSSKAPASTGGVSTTIEGTVLNVKKVDSSKLKNKLGDPVDTKNMPTLKNESDIKYPIDIVFGDINPLNAKLANDIGMDVKTIVVGDPLRLSIDAVVSPANTIGEMSGGYDLVIRNQLGGQVQDIAQSSLRQKNLGVYKSRLVETGSAKTPYMVITPTVTGKLGANIKPPPAVAEDIAQATYNTIMTAGEAGINRLGLTGLGTGVADPTGVLVRANIKAMAHGVDEAMWDLSRGIKKRAKIDPMD